MGILGLMSYINNRSDRFLDPFELHDTHLVIDGCSLCSQLYNRCVKSNCAFGGDYDKYAHCVDKFFSDLLKCNIIPLVLFDGGREVKKLQTTMIRLRQRIKVVSKYDPTAKLKFFPLLMRDVFVDVMREKGLKCVQCSFEADKEIAAIAKVLRCPVLSFDSDFYIYDVLYIPINTLESGVWMNPDKGRFVKHCKIYRFEHLLRSFSGLDRSLLPLAAAVLGNDYVKRKTFKDFFRNLKITKFAKRSCSKHHKRIEALLNWLNQQQTLNTAVAYILSRLPREIRKRTLAIIEMMIEQYTNFSPCMLLPLGFSKEYVTKVKVKLAQQNSTFKFQGDIDNLIFTEEPLREDESDLSDFEDEDIDKDEDIDETNEFNVTDHLNNCSLSSIVPPWFIKEFTMARFPPYFVDMLLLHLYTFPVQIEDHSYPTTHIINLKIIGMMYKLLTAGSNESNKCLKYIVRSEKNRIMQYELEHTKHILPHIQFPQLEILYELPLNVRKKIFDETLGISGISCINEFPAEWKLYIVTAIYWAQQERVPSTTNCHMYSLLFTMLFNIVDSNIGHYRTMYSFKKRYCTMIQSIMSTRNSAQLQLNCSMNVAEAYDKVTKEDCLLIASFFINNFAIDPKMEYNSKMFNVTIVHVFAQFQSCLRHISNFNALLGYPYPQTKVAKMFNGTLLYNLHSNFKKRNDVEAYISQQIFQECPSLLQLWNILLTVVKALLPKVFENKETCTKRRRSRNKVKNKDEDYFTSDEDTTDTNCTFYDDNNYFSILTGSR